MNEPPTPRNAELRRALVKLFVVIAAALLLMLTLIFVLWQRSPKPP